METKVNYTIVGVFVLLLGAALIGGILWLSAGSKYNNAFDVYVAYLSESVSGLNVNAPVKYRGVEVGRVLEIALDPENPQRVRLMLGITHGTPIKTDTVATLRLQGLTGIAYVELSGSTREAPPLTANPGQKYPVIATGPSLLARLDTAVSDLLTNLNGTAQNVNAILDEETRQSFKQALRDISRVTRTIADNREEIESGIHDAAQAAKELRKVTQDFSDVMKRVGKTADSLERMANDATKTSATARSTIEAAGGDLHRFTADTLPEAERVLVEVRELTASMRRVTEQLEQNPGVLLYGTEAPPPGPGE